LTAENNVANPYVTLARRALEEYIKEGRVLLPPRPLPAALAEKAGVFVSLKKRGQLRGCIGTFLPTRPNLAEEIIENAVSAATRDPRFPPVSSAELEELEVSVDILTPPEPVSGPRELDPRRYGVLVRSGSRSGLLLPDLEGVDTVEEQLAIVLRKAGISPAENYRLFRFTVTRHHQA
jgi:AmmeMemoRadiSam system protein A